MSHKISLLFGAISNQSSVLEIRMDQVESKALEHDNFGTLLKAREHISYDYDRAKFSHATQNA
jgi:hypothetical protein